MNQAEDLDEQDPWDGDLSELEGDVASVVDGPGADLDQPFAPAGERPVFDFLRQCQCLLGVMSGRLGGVGMARRLLYM